MNSVWDVPIRERPNAVEVPAACPRHATGVRARHARHHARRQRLDRRADHRAVRRHRRRGRLRVDQQPDLPHGVQGPHRSAARVGGSSCRSGGGRRRLHHAPTRGRRPRGRNVRAASDTYGTFAVVIGLLAWLYLLAQVSVAAAEVNVVAARRLWPRASWPTTSPMRTTVRCDQHAEVGTARGESTWPSSSTPISTVEIVRSYCAGRSRAAKRRTRRPRLPGPLGQGHQRPIPQCGLGSNLSQGPGSPGRSICVEPDGSDVR